MSQFNFTAEEDALIVQAMHVLADIQAASQGQPADDVAALIAKIAEQQTPNVAVDPAPVAEQPPSEPTAEEVEAHFAKEEADEKEAE